MAANNNPILASIQAARTGTRFPVLSVVRETPALAAVVSKLVQASNTTSNYGAGGAKQIQNPDAFQMRQLAHRMGRNAGDAEMVMQLLPDMELSAQILVSSILSPKDMMSTEITFVPGEGIVDAQQSAELLVLIRQHFDQVYKIKSSLGKILRDILFVSGAHIRAVIPESSVDELINRPTAVTMEALSDAGVIDLKSRQPKWFGVLGPYRKESEYPKGISLESMAGSYRPSDLGTFDCHVYLQGGSFDVLNPTKEQVQAANGGVPRVRLEALVDPYMTVTDNPAILKMPMLAERTRQHRLANLYGAGMGSSSFLATEAYGDNKLSDAQIASALYRPSRVGHKPVVVMKTQQQLERRSVGAPLILELPPESVIPVHTPGQEEKHIGYFVLLDQNGNPISRKNQRDSYGELADRMNMGGGGGSSQFASQLIQRVSHLVNGFDAANNQHLDYSAKVYAEMVEADLLARLRNGVYNNGVALARNQEVYRIMLARTLQAQQTQMLFLPVELVTYFAFSYTPEGVGESLMDKMKILNSLRAMLMFSDTMASIRNSIGLTDLKIKLDENDPDPYKTIERIMSEYLRAKQQGFPLGVNSPVDIVNYLQRAAIDFSFEGHNGLPDISIEKSERNSTYPKSDDSLSENLRKRAAMATGLNPESIDNSFNGESATSVVASNIQLSRRVQQIQENFCPLVADHTRKTILADENLMPKLREIVARDWDNEKYDLSEMKRRYPDLKPEQLKELAVRQIVIDYVSVLEVELPKPSVTTTSIQFEALDNYIKLLDVALEAWISDEFITNNAGGDAATALAEQKKAIRAFIIREFMNENNILPELGKIATLDQNGQLDEDFMKNIVEHSKTIVQSIDQYLKMMKPVKDESNKVLEAANIHIDPNGMGGTSMPGGGADSFGSFGGAPDMGGGMGDLSAPSEGGGDMEGSESGLPEGGSEDNPTTPTGEESVLPRPGAQASDLGALDDTHPDDKRGPEDYL